MVEHIYPRALCSPSQRIPDAPFRSREPTSTPIRSFPKQFLKRIERTGFGPSLFFDWRYRADGSPNPEFELNRPSAAGATILITGANFGCGSSREHAPWALADYGFRAIIAPSFADIFFGNCCQNGLLPVTLAEAEVGVLARRAESPEGYDLTVDLRERSRARRPGLRGELRGSIDYRREMLLKGLDEIGRTLLQRSADRRLRASARGADGARVRVRRYTIAVLPGDGIGPEVTAEAVRVLRGGGRPLRLRARDDRVRGGRGRRRGGRRLAPAGDSGGRDPSRRGAARCRGPSLPGRRRGPATAGGRAAGAPQAARRVRQPAAGDGASRAAARLPAPAGAPRRRGPADRARAARRAVLRPAARAGARRRGQHHALLASPRSSGWPGSRSRRRGGDAVR